MSQILCFKFNICFLSQFLRIFSRLVAATKIEKGLNAARFLPWGQRVAACACNADAGGLACTGSSVSILGTEGALASRMIPEFRLLQRMQQTGAKCEQ